MQLIKHPRFLEEYKNWYDKISRVTDENAKTELTRLLQQLVNEVKRIDSHHNDLLIKTSVDHSIKESRESLISLRRKISNKITECETAGLIEKQYS